ncbi:cell division protein FtsX [Candidatus Chrysopegis kryptomonas]|uniref:Cell division protein FtsX n=1 Tax=Candidatus Chryseopegocella kryptomonas TaxID=1633643 RepID=A0A0P1MT88_9BACT|nr:permease-like cell division protein FtsX [Candidatus Chrysopegis kryptomonas]CUS99094.1 cell division transport system permease protein [Candidatus Chrysopegis kryptomonas]
MRFGYVIKEAISGFRKSKFSSFASIFVLFISLFAIGSFVVAGYNLNRLIKAIKEKIEIEVFLKDGLSNSQIDSLRRKIISMDEVERVVFISKDEAAKIFEEEFGENIFNILDFNPLPASFKIKLKENYRTTQGVENLVRKLRRFPEFEEVRYRKALLSILERRFKILTQSFLLSGVLLALISILLVINTIRLTIQAKRKLINTMQLVGATRGFIMSPFLIQGFLQGLIAGLFSSGLIYLLVEVIIPQLPDDVITNVNIPLFFYLLVVFAGCLLGFVGSWISARKYITYKIIT